MSESDRELLELAAKAAGIKGEYVERPFPCIRYARDGRISYWNPLQQDGTALRLAVKLKLRVKTPSVDTCIVKDSSRHLLAMEIDADAVRATRRAIVRAAAEIGKS